MTDGRATLSLDPETAFFILMKARAFDEKVAPSDLEDGSNAIDDKTVEILEDYLDDPTYAELMEALRDLNIDQQIDLLALLWIGRGDFTPDEWADAVAQANSMSHKHIPEYVSQTPLASDFLEEGLNAMGIPIEEFQKAHL